MSASRGVEREQLIEHGGREVRWIEYITYAIISRSQEFLFLFSFLPFSPLEIAYIVNPFVNRNVLMLVYGTHAVHTFINLLEGLWI